MDSPPDATYAEKIPTQAYLLKYLRYAKSGVGLSTEGILALGDIPLANGEVISTSAVSSTLEYLGKGGSMGLLRNYSKEELDAVYVLACSYSNNNELESAVVLLRYLCLQDNLNAKYWLRLGEVQKKQNELQEALNTLLIGLHVSGGNPNFPITSAEIYLTLGDLESAKSYAEYAAVLIGMAESKDAELTKRVNAIRSTIERRSDSKNMGDSL